MQDWAAKQWENAQERKEDERPSGTQDAWARKVAEGQEKSVHEGGIYGTQDWRPRRPPSPPQQPKPVLTEAQLEQQKQRWQDAAAAHNNKQQERAKQRQDAANAAYALSQANRPKAPPKATLFQRLREQKRMREASKAHKVLLMDQQKMGQQTVLQMASRFNSMRMDLRPQASSSNQLSQSGASVSRAASPAFKPVSSSSTRRF